MNIFNKNIKNSKIYGKVRNSQIQNTIIGKNTTVESSYISDSEIGDNCKIGPFTHIRPQCKVGNNCRIGNFVELKNAVVNDNTKISHHAYVGDAIIGKNCNIGCGVIFVNYNGKSKNKIQIGDNVFIGSNVNLIAPLNIQNNVYICAGTTVTKDLKEFDFVIGRVRQEVKENKAQEYLKEIL